MTGTTNVETRSPRRARGGFRARSVFALVLAGLGALAARLPSAEPGELLAVFPFRALAPQDITWDGQVFYVTSFIEPRIYRYSGDLRTALPSLQAPVNSGWGFTGIAYNEDPETPRLWVAEPFSREIRELDMEAKAVHRVLAPAFEPAPSGVGGDPVPRGMAFHRQGDGGRGSLFIAESVSSLLYEVALDGRILSTFPHPDGPRGFPGGAGAAAFTDVDLIRDSQGFLTGFHVTGGRRGVDFLRRLDESGNYTGFSIPLGDAGSSVSGFLTVPFPLAEDDTRPAVVALLDSTAEFAVLDPSEPPLGEVFGLAAQVEPAGTGGSVRLTWRSAVPLEGVGVLRDCLLVAELQGDPGQAVDPAGGGRLGPGVYSYLVEGWVGAASTTGAPALAVLGGGRVLRHGPAPGESPVDLAVTPAGLIYAGDFRERKVRVYREDDFQEVDTLELDFLGEEDRLGGVACFPSDQGPLYLYGVEQNTIFIADLVGRLLGSIPVSLPNDPQDPQDKAVVAGLDFDSAGGPDRQGAFWLVELVRERVYQVDMEGRVLWSFSHPAAVASPVPPRAPLHNYMGGIAGVPGSGPGGMGFGILDLTSGGIHERDVKRILRVDALTGAVLDGHEIPLTGQDLAAPANFVGLARPTSSTNSLYLIAASGASSRLLEVDSTLPSPRPIIRLAARQLGRAAEVSLTFDAPDSYERVLIHRDCGLLRELPPEAFAAGRAEVIDSFPPTGLHRYDVRGVKGGVETGAATVELMVGPGSLLERRFSFPVIAPNHVGRDPSDGTLLLTSSTPRQERSLFLFGPDLAFREELAEVIPEPYSVASAAFRRTAAGSFIYVLGWTVPSQIGGGQAFKLFVLSRSGAPAGEHPLDPPRPTNGFVTYPTGLAWDSSEDVFYYLERNSDTIVRMSPEGRTLALIRHPAPPRHSSVYNLGLTIDPENGALLLTGAGKRDRRVTTALQLTRSGRLTGISIPLGHLPLNPLHGIVMDGPDLLAGGYAAAGEVLRVQAFQALPPPAALRCMGRGAEALLTWNPSPGYEAIEVRRDGLLVAVLDGAARSYQDASPGRALTVVYSVAGRVGGQMGKNSLCELPPLPAGFTRGDADLNGIHDVSDAILILNHLFLGGAAPPCDDAADADDSGYLSITDPINVLGRLFLGTDPLPPPYPDPGHDPTPDDLTCS